jgi:tetratricopeptide (TPR) repeat protein
LPLQNVSAERDDDYVASGVTEALIAGMAPEAHIPRWLKSSVSTPSSRALLFAWLTRFGYPYDSLMWPPTCTCGLQLTTALSRLHIYMNRLDRAIEHVRMAQRLDPLSPSVQINVANVFYSGRQFTESIREARLALELMPDFGNALYLLGLSLHFAGDPEGAIRELERARTVAPEHPSPITGLGYVLAQNGHRDAAFQLLEELKRRATRADVTPYDFAELYAGLGETRLALDHLERSKQLRLPELLGIASDPLFDPIRHEPQFKDLLVAIGLDGT